MTTQSTVPLFERASRMKIRFETPVGNLSADELWDLPLVAAPGKKTNLDDIARDLYLQLRDTPTVSFVRHIENTATDRKQLAFDVVKHIIDVKISEAEALQSAKAKSEKKQKLLAILDKKEEASLEGLSAEEIRAQIAAL